MLGAITGAFVTAVLNASRIEMSLIDKMRRIHRLARRIAKIALPPELLQEA